MLANFLSSLSKVSSFTNVRMAHAKRTEYVQNMPNCYHNHLKSFRVFKDPNSFGSHMGTTNSDAYPKSRWKMWQI